MPIPIYKKEGETPLAALTRLRDKRPELEDTRLSYAGRLDPMARGLLLVLVGDENNEREDYLSLDKRYEFDVLFGVATDTFDILGIVHEIVDTELEIPQGTLEHAVGDFRGQLEMQYPPYSSYTIDGTPLWKWAREERLDEIDLPTHETEIHSLEITGTEIMNKETLEREVRERIAKVEGDFRQEQILYSWREALSDAPDAFVLVSLSIHCSAGTYVRRIAERLGKKVGVPALAYRIKRTWVGKYTLDDVKE